MSDPGLTLFRNQYFRSKMKISLLYDMYVKPKTETYRFHYAAGAVSRPLPNTLPQKPWTSRRYLLLSVCMYIIIQDTK